MTQKFFWYDVMTPDVPASEKFYAAVMGWEIAGSGMPGAPPYLVVSAGGETIGGIMALPPGAGFPPMWTGYIHSHNVDGDVARVTAAGGTVCRPAFDVPGAGRIACVADPSGAMFNLMQPASAEQQKPIAAGTPGTFAWHDYGGNNGSAAFAWYSKLFGWVKTGEMPMGPDNPYIMFGYGGEPVGGMMTAREGSRTGWMFYSATDNIDRARARVKANGGLAQEPMQVPGDVWVIDCKDPHGASFGMVGPR